MFFNSKKSFLILVFAIFFFSFTEKSNATFDLDVYPNSPDIIKSVNLDLNIVSRVFFEECKKKHGYSFLMYSIECENEELFNELIVAGEDVNWSEVLEMVTALHYAALFGSLYMIRILLEYGANLYAKDIDGNTPLHWAAIREDPNNFEFLKYYYDNSFAINDDFKSPFDLYNTVHVENKKSSLIF